MTHLCRFRLKHLRCQRNDLHEAPFAQLSRNRSEDAFTDRLSLSLTSTAAFRSNRMYVPSLRRCSFTVCDYRFDDLPLLDFPLRRRLFD